MATVPSTNSQDNEDTIGGVVVPSITAPAAPQSAPERVEEPSPVEVPPNFFDPTPPPGFELDVKEDPAPPPGFTLDTAPTPPGGFTLDPLPPVTNAPDGFKATPEESFLNDTSVGRVLDAVGEGFSDGFGTADLGLSSESEKFLKENKIIGKEGNPILQPLRTFNEAIIRPLAIVMDFGLVGALRNLGATIEATAGGMAQITKELGLTNKSARSVKKDILDAVTDPALLVMFPPVATASVAVRRGAARRVTGKAVNEPRPQVAAAIEREAVYAPIPEEAAAVGRPAGVKVAKDVKVAEDTLGSLEVTSLQTTDDVSRIIEQRAIRNAGPGGVDRTRGTLSFEETEAMADALGMTGKQLLKTEIGTAGNAEQLLAARGLLVDSARTLKQLAQKAGSPNALEGEIVAFQEASLKHQMIIETVRGLRAEAGRALSQFRIMAAEVKEGEALSVVISDVAAGADLEGLAMRAKAIAELPSVQGISKLVMEARATKTDMFMELWINALLSNPVTHMSNIIGNSITAAMAVPETAIAAAVGKVGISRTLFKGIELTDRVRAGEAVGRTQALYQAAIDGVRAGGKAFRSEIPTSGVSKLDQLKRQAVPSVRLREGVQNKTVNVPVLGDVPIPLTGEIAIGGKQGRLSGRFLMAEDEFFKSIARRQEMNAQAFRIADREGWVGKVRAQRIAGLIADPTAAMIKAADTHALTVTFQNPLGKLGNAVLSASNANPALKVIAPFIRTPSNIIKFAGRRIPGIGNFISKEDIAIMKGKRGGAAFDEAMGRQVMGGMVMAGTFALVQQGLITGNGPTDTKERAAKRLTGWQPYSFKIGDTYYSYARMEPLALLIGLVADFNDAVNSGMDDDEADTIAAALFMSTAKNLTSKTWLRGPSDLFQALSDPDRYGDRYIRRLAGTIVPAGVAQVARSGFPGIVEGDPTLREVRTVLDGILARLPGDSADLKPLRDVFGRPIVREGAAGPDILSPIFTSTDRNDPVADELLELEIYPGKLSREVRDVELTDEEYEEHQINAGSALRTALEAYVNTPGWSDLPKFSRQEIVNRAIAKTRKQANAAMLLTPEFLGRVLEARSKAVQDKLDQIED